MSSAAHDSVIGRAFHGGGRCAPNRPRPLGEASGREWSLGLARSDNRAVHPVSNLVGKDHRCVDEPRAVESVFVLSLAERSGYATHSASPRLAVVLAQSVVRYDITDADASSRPQQPEYLGQHRRLVGRQVDYAVRDDHVDALVGQGDLLDVALEELDVLDAR